MQFFKGFRLGALSLLFLIGAYGFLFAQEKTSTPTELFRPTSNDISIHFKEEVTYFSTSKKEITGEFWASRNPLGLSLRIDHFLETRVTQIVLLFPQADPFLARFLLVPQKSLCYGNRFWKKDALFDPHKLAPSTYWHNLLDRLYQINQLDSGKQIGEEKISGYSCKKISLGKTPDSGLMVWYAPELDLILRVDFYQNGKVIITKQVVDLEEKRFQSSVFKPAAGCPVKFLSAQAFDSLDLAALGK